MFFWGASRRARVLPGSLGRFGASVLRAVTALCGGSAAGQRRFFAAAQGVEYALRNAFERKSSLATFHWRPVGTKDSLTSSLVMAIGACGQNDSRAKIPSVGMPLAFKSARGNLPYSTLVAPRDEPALAETPHYCSTAVSCRKPRRRTPARAKSDCRPAAALRSTSDLAPPHLRSKHAQRRWPPS